MNASTATKRTDFAGPKSVARRIPGATLPLRISPWHSLTRTALALVAATLPWSVGASASGAVITAAGRQLGVGAGLRTTTVPKTLDADGDQAYGTAGWEFFAVGGGNIEGAGFEFHALIGLPSFIGDVAAVTGGASIYAAYSSYMPIDDPRQPIGSSVNDVISGFAYVGSVAAGEERDMFQIQISQNAPAFRVGFLVNQEGSFRQFPSQFRLQSGSSGATLAVDQNSGSGARDMYFFDVLGASAGDVIDVFATRGPSRPNIGISGITFDVLGPPRVTPPASASACVRGQASLSVSASGPGSFTYQWQIADASAPGGWADLADGVVFTNSGARRVGAFAGSQTPTLTASAFAALGFPVIDPTPLRCVVSSAYGSTASNPTTLTICVADTDDGTGTGMCDGGVTIDDLLYYITIFADGVARADVDDGSSTGTPDGGVTIDDLLYYLQRFEAGC